MRLSLFVLAGILWGQTPEIAVLKGLKTVRVVVEPPAPELLNAGLSTAALQATIEARLRQGGVAVDESANEFVGLKIGFVTARRMPLAISLELACYQIVELTRDRSLKSMVETWETTDLVLTPAKSVKEAAREAVAGLADTFVRAYRSANP